MKSPKIGAALAAVRRTAGAVRRRVPVLLVLCTGAAGTCTDAWADRPPPTAESLYERAVTTVDNVQWYDADTLIGEFREKDEAQTLIRKVSLDGAVGDILGEGRLTTLSPDRDLMVLRSNDRWRVQNLKSGESTELNLAGEEDIEFRSLLKPVWSRDGKYLAIVEYHKMALENLTAKVFGDKGSYIADVTSVATPKDQWVSRISIVGRQDLRPISTTHLESFVGGAEWSVDGALLISHTAFRSDITTVQRLWPGDSEADAVYRSRGRYHRLIPSTSPDGRHLAVVLDVDNRTWDDFQSLLLVDPGNGHELRRLTDDLPLLSGEYFWSRDGREVYVRARNGGLDQIYAIPLEGSPRKLTTGPRRHFDMDLSKDGHRLSYQTIDGYGRRDIRIMDIESERERVIKVLDAPDEEFTLGRWEQLRWPSTDGVNPFGFLITPPGFSASNQYPMIVSVHGGGPGSSLFLSSSLNGGKKLGPLVWHAWAAAGYVVFIPDYRSSGGYGPGVIADRYDAGELSAIRDIEDIDSGVDYVVDQGFVEPDKVAIYGHSAGGQRVYILLTRTKRYGAAAIHEATTPDPASNFIVYSSGEYTGGYPASVFRHNYGGTLAEAPGRYKANYMLDSYRNSTPTLIMLGNESLGGVSHMPNEVLFSILSQNDVPTRLVKFVNDGHNYKSVETARYAYDSMLAWFAEHLTESPHEAPVQ